MIIRNRAGELLDIAWPRNSGTYDLSWANLSGADLSWANLSGANLSGANLRRAGVLVLGQCQRGYTFLLRTHDGPRIQAGCRDFTLGEAREHWTGAHADDPALQAHCLAMVAAAESIVAAAERQEGSDGNVHI